MRRYTFSAETIVFVASILVIGVFTTAEVTRDDVEKTTTQQSLEVINHYGQIEKPEADAVFETKAAIEAEEEVKNRVKAMSVAAEQKPTPTTLESFRGKSDFLDPNELKELLSLAGFEGETLKLAWGIVMRESRGKPTAHNKNSSTGDNSYGLFQINMIGKLGTSRREDYGLSSNETLFDPVTNTQIAYLMSNKGRDFGAWGVGKNAYNGGKVGDLYHWVSKFPS